MEFRKHFGYDVEAASDESACLKDPGESLTIQSQSEDADLNVMMRRFGVTGKLPDNPRVPRFGDFTGISDFRTALHAIEDAQDRFMEFPADVRARFENDPQKVMEFMAVDANYDEAVKLGLVNPKSPPQAAKILEAPVAPAPVVP